MKSLLNLLMVLAVVSMPAHAASFEAGRDYTVIAEQPTAKPVVQEFFSYGCGGCFTFEPFVAALKPAIAGKATFEYIPADFGGGFWTPTQELFLVMEALGLRESLHDAAFRFLHVDRNAPSSANMKRFLAMHGVDEQKYDKTRASFPVHVKEKRYDQQVKALRISSTPTVVVNGKYRIENARLQNPQEFVKLVEYLLQNP